LIYVHVILIAGLGDPFGGGNFDRRIGWSFCGGNFEFKPISMFLLQKYVCRPLFGERHWVEASPKSGNHSSAPQTVYPAHGLDIVWKTRLGCSYISSL
jgi:hypothetical protein